jgi:hypothetical protein
MDTRVLPVAGAFEDFSDDDEGLPYDTNALQLPKVTLSVACITEALTVRVEARALQ